MHKAQRWSIIVNNDACSPSSRDTSSNKAAESRNQLLSIECKHIARSAAIVVESDLPASFSANLMIASRLAVPRTEIIDCTTYRLSGIAEARTAQLVGRRHRRFSSHLWRQASAGRRCQR